MSRGRGTRGGKPRRGPHGPNALITGGPGEYEPQGGAGPEVLHEGADLEAREFGVPEADIPGGVRHLVNPQTIPAKPAVAPPRPADVHKFHGVPPIDLGGYEIPATENHDTAPPRPEPEPQWPDAVPVYQVEGPGKKRDRRSMAAWNVNVHNSTQEPSRVANYDPERVEILLLNEDSATDIRISEKLDSLQSPGAQGTGPAGEGALIWHGTNSYLKLKTQSEIFAITTSASSSARLSVIIITETPEKA